MTGKGGRASFTLAFPRWWCSVVFLLGASMSNTRLIEAAVSHPIANQLRQLSEDSGVSVVSLVRLACEFAVCRGFAGRPVRDARGCLVGSSDEKGCVWFGRVGVPGTHDFGEVVWSGSRCAGEGLRLVA